MNRSFGKDITKQVLNKSDANFQRPLDKATGVKSTATSKTNRLSIAVGGSQKGRHTVGIQNIS
jgi:hypothetical protein